VKQVDWLTRRTSHDASFEVRSGFLVSHAIAKRDSPEHNLAKYIFSVVTRYYQYFAVFLVYLAHPVSKLWDEMRGHWRLRYRFSPQPFSMDNECSCFCGYCFVFG
jgi:hypothetical protein